MRDFGEVLGIIWLSIYGDIANGLLRKRFECDRHKRLALQSGLNDEVIVWMVFPNPTTL